ncbi:MAG: hypothetical protein HY070_13045 [Chloroflexi bacterium]|nr:hypothetical protein [Chloroflexota bacterium]
MELAQIDLWAVAGTSAWHRASAIAKIIGTLFLISAIISARDWRVLALLYAALLLIVALARLPARKIALIAAYPAAFSFLFVLSSRGGFDFALLVIARAATAALTMLLLISTTPYIEIFAALGRVLPALIADGLLVTYRSFFLLLETFARLVTGIQLRGAYARGRAHGIAQMAEVIGVTFLHALDLAEASHAALHLRGYENRIPSSDRWRQMNARDVLPLSLGFIALTISILSR